jgi:hypothetical protein
MTQSIETVATVLETELTPTIERWMERVDKVSELTRILLSYEDRMGHLPQLLREVILRLRLEEGAECLETSSAHDHGKVRFDQGYSVPMLVEESLLLQVSIFDTLRRERKRLDSSIILSDVVKIADECDKQLKHAVETFMELDKRGKIAAA